MNKIFDPNNAIIKLCINGMALEERGNSEDAIKMFHKAWDEATDDYKLKWMETSLQCALKINDDNVKSAYPTLYLHIAKCYEELGDSENAKRNYELSNSAKVATTDEGPFYHGTKADLKFGDLLTAGGISNFNSEIKMDGDFSTVCPKDQ